MEKEELLAISRRENKNRDLAEADSLLNYWDSYGTAI